MGTIAVVPSPGGASSRYDALTSVACTSAVACTAAGSYVHAGNGLPMAADGAVGGFGPPTGIALPSDTATSMSASGISAIACPQPGTCVGVGSFEDTDRSVQALTASGAGGGWSSAGPLTLPTDAAGGNQFAQLSSVSCSSVDCTAVGSYLGADGATELLAVTDTNGSWASATTVALPKLSGSFARVTGAPDLSSVSCVGQGTCTAVGAALNRAGGLAPLVAVESNGAFRPATFLAMPKGSIVRASSALTSVSCSAAGTCVAVGYVARPSGTLPVIDTEANGVWGPMVPIFVPRLSPTAIGGVLSSVACSSARVCAAVGSVQLTGGASAPAALVDTGGHWQRLEVDLAAIRARGSSSRFTSVACPVAVECVTVGSRSSTSGAGTRTVGIDTSIRTAGSSAKSPSGAFVSGEGR